MTDPRFSVLYRIWDRLVSVKYIFPFAFRSETLATVNENFLVAAAEGQPLENVFVYPELVTPETAKNFYVGNVRH